MTVVCYPIGLEAAEYSKYLGKSTMVASTVSCLMEWYSRVVFEERKNIAIAEDNIKDDFSCKVQGLLYHLIRVCMLHTYVYRL